MDKVTKMKFNVLAIMCIILFAFAVTPKTLQNDTYYTIAIGEHIVQNGIDGEDPFAWTELKYTYPHWMYDVSMYYIYDIRWNDRNLYINNSFKHGIRSSLIYYKHKGK